MASMPFLFIGDQHLVVDPKGKELSRIRYWEIQAEGDRVIAGALAHDVASDALTIHQHYPPGVSPALLDLDSRSQLAGTNPVHANDNESLTRNGNTVNVTDRAARAIIAHYGLRHQFDYQQHGFSH